MRRSLPYIGIGLGILLMLGFMLIPRNARMQAARLRAVQAERDRLATERSALEQKLLALTQQGEADRQLLGTLWRLVYQDRPLPTPRAAPGGGSGYDITRLKTLAQEQGGDLNRVISEILGTGPLEATLQRHATDPAFWVAAASLTADRAQALRYLESAMERFPESAVVQAAFIESRRDQPAADPSTRTAIENLRAADPTSSLADHYDAYFRFKGKDVEGGMQALAAASEKDRFTDHRLELMMSRYECLLENGCSDGGALALSAFSLPFDHLPMLRETGQEALRLALEAAAAGQTDRALQTAEYVARVGRNLSASGRFLVYDRVGMGLQQAALETQRQLQEARGNALQVEEIGFQLGAVRERSAQVDTMAQDFGGALAAMTDGDVVGYIESTIMHGEFTTLQRLLGTR